MKELQQTLVDITHPSLLMTMVNPVYGLTAYYAADDIRDGVLSNLRVIEKIVKDIKVRINAHVPNDDNYYMLKKMMVEGSKETVFGIPVGASIVRCVKPLLTFSGNNTQKLATANAALKRIASIRKAVK